MIRMLGWLDQTDRAPRFGFAFGFTCFMLALVIRLALDESLPAGFPFLTFFPAVIIAAFVAGLWPGIMVAGLSTIASWYFFLPPFRSFVLTGSNVLALGFFMTIVAIDIAVIYVLKQALQRLRVERERAHALQVKAEQLAENRETLFKELQHRVSNNLQIVSALMSLQKGTVRDEDARRIIDEAAGRLALIGKIHRNLHDPNGQLLAFGPFLKELCHDILDASGATNVVCLLQTEEMTLSADKTIPVALIVAELVSNALEHAFMGKPKGTLSVTLKPTGEGLIDLTVADDGPGLPETFDLATTRSLGLRIVRELARQIGGTFQMSGREGTVCRLVFPA